MAVVPATYAYLLGPAAAEPPPCLLPMGAVRVRLGFPSPAEDFLDDEVDLNSFLVRNKAATFLYRADGWSMRDAGINDSDILIIDRSVTPRDGDLVIATWDGNQPTCKVLKRFETHTELHSANPDHPVIMIEPEQELEVFAVVGVVRQVQRRSARVGTGRR
jgi:DNA polymerase V